MPSTVSGYLEQQAFLDQLRLATDAIHSKAPDLIDAEDLFQETVNRGLEHAEQCRATTRKRCLAWLRQIANNYLTDLLRQAGRRPTQHELIADIPGESDPTVDANDIRTLVWATLTASEAALLEARAAGVPFKILALMLNENEATVRQRCYRLTKQLADLLEDRER